MVLERETIREWKVYLNTLTGELWLVDKTGFAMEVKRTGNVDDISPHHLK